MRGLLIPLATLLALGGCSSSSNGEQGQTAASKVETFDVAEAPSSPKTAKSVVPEAAALPKIAYVYGYTFKLASDRIGGVEDAHVGLCDKLGAARCQVVAMDRSAGEGEYVHGSLKLLVAASEARRFGTALTQVVTGAGGSTVDTKVSAEDLSKQMVDTEARIRAKDQVVARLMEILRTRTGTVAQLVEAERAVSQAQEELDAARSWMAEMRQRVATSTIQIEYTSLAPMSGGFGGPVRAALNASTALFGQAVSMLIYLTVFLVPWLVAIAAVVSLVRYLRRRGWLRWLGLRGIYK